jgi:putative selenium metabolism hydrolase
VGFSELVTRELSQVIDDQVQKRESEIVRLTQELVRIPSPSGSESDAADSLVSMMKERGFENPHIDGMGNVIGTVRGRIGKKNLLYNGHIDHVPPGDMKDPYSAPIIDGSRFGVTGDVVFGRGSSDMKAGIISMMMGALIASEISSDLEQSIVITGVVLEDATPGHPGPRYLIEKDGLKPSAAIVTESSNLEIATSHRGSALIEISFVGKSCHSSRPELGINALYHAARFVDSFPSLFDHFQSHASLGHPNAAITNVKAYPGALNMIPERCEVFVDFRYTPAYGVQEFLSAINSLISELKSKDDRISAKVSVTNRQVRSYTGYETDVLAINLPFYIDTSDPFVTKVLNASSQVSKRDVIHKWTFGTDAAYFSSLNIPTVGIGPGEERFAHTPQEHVRISDLINATKIYTAINLDYCNPQTS